MMKLLRLVNHSLNKMTGHKFIPWFAVVLLLLSSIGFVSASQETSLSLQGRLTYDNGSVVESGVLTVNISGSESCDGDVFSEVYHNVLEDGVFDVVLGDTACQTPPCDLSLDYNSPYWLCISVDDGGPVGGPYLFRGGQGQVGSDDLSETGTYTLENIVSTVTAVFQGVLNVSGPANFFDTLFVGGYTLIDDTLEVTGEAFLNVLHANEAHVNGNFYVTGDINREDWTNTSFPGSWFVYSLQVFNGRLYAGEADVFVLNESGTGWTNMSLSPSGYVMSLDVYNGRLYAGEVGEVHVLNESGSGWINTSFPGSFYAYYLEVYNGRLYASSYQAVYVLNSSGVGWTDTGFPTSTDNVWSLAVYNGRLYASNQYPGEVYVLNEGGVGWSNTSFPGEYSYSLAVYNGRLYADGGGEVFVLNSSGSGWSNTSFPGLYAVLSFTVYNGRLYGGNSGGDVYVLNESGIGWTETSYPEALHVYSLGVYNGRLYGGSSGEVRYYQDSLANVLDNPVVSGEESSQLVRGDLQVDGTASVSGLNSGPAVVRGDVNITSDLNVAGTINMENWTHMSFPGSYVLSFGVYEGRLYVGGDGYVYVLNESGVGWTDTSLPTDSTYPFVYSLVVYEGRLYAGEEGDVFVLNSSGVGWTDTGFTASDYAYSLAVYNGRLYASEVDDVYVLDEDGSGWTETGFTATGQIRSLVVYNGRLYAGEVDDVYVLDEDGSGWSETGFTATGQIYSLAVYDSRLYAGEVGDVYVLNSSGSGWTETSFPSVGDVRSLGVYNGRLYAGELNDVFVLNSSGVDWTDTSLPGAGYIYSLGVYDGRLYAGEVDDIFSYRDSLTTVLDNPLVSGEFGSQYVQGDLEATGTLSGGVVNTGPLNIRGNLSIADGGSLGCIGSTPNSETCTAECGSLNPARGCLIGFQDSSQNFVSCDTTLSTSDSCLCC